MCAHFTSNSTNILLKNTFEISEWFNRLSDIVIESLISLCALKCPSEEKIESIVTKENIRIGRISTF